MKNQRDYDIIITNTLIVYDNFLEPYPHAVLRYAKVGGSSFKSPARIDYRIIDVEPKFTKEGKEAEFPVALMLEGQFTSAFERNPLMRNGYTTLRQFDMNRVASLIDCISSLIGVCIPDITCSFFRQAFTLIAYELHVISDQ